MVPWLCAERHLIAGATPGLASRKDKARASCLQTSCLRDSTWLFVAG